MDAPIDPCVAGTTGPEGWDLRTSPLEYVASTSDEDALREAGLDPAYNHRQMGVIRLHEGSAYRICVYWSVAEPSFEAGVELIEAYDILTPDALDVTFLVATINTTDDATLPMNDLVVSVKPTGRGIMVGHPWCGAWANPLDVTGLVAVDSVVCQANPKSIDLYKNGARVTMTATDLDGVRHTTEHVVPVRSCDTCIVPSLPEFFRLELPSGAPRRDFWCGGFGDACDRPSDESFGTIVLEVRYGNSRSVGTRSWAISDVSDLGDQRAEPAETPRLDTSPFPAVIGTGLDQIVRVPILADRPVSVSVSLRQFDGSAACVVGGGPTTKTSDVLSTTHRIEFQGLCPGQFLASVVELTAADGTTSRWYPNVDDPAVFGPGELWLRGTVTVGLIRWTGTAELFIDLPTDAVQVHTADLRVEGRAITWINVIEQTATRGCRVPRGAPIVGRAPNLVAFSDLDMTFEVDIDVTLLRPTCIVPIPIDGGAFVQPDPFSLRATIDIDDIVLGEPITLTVSQVVPSLGDEAIEVRLVVIFEESS